MPGNVGTRKLLADVQSSPFRGSLRQLFRHVIEVCRVDV